MVPDEYPGFLSRWSRVSLRAKGVAALSVPMLALFAALYAIPWTESAAGRADLAAAAAYDTRAELLRYHIFLLDAGSAVSDQLVGRRPGAPAFQAAIASLQRSEIRLG